MLAGKPAFFIPGEPMMRTMQRLVYEDPKPLPESTLSPLFCDGRSTNVRRIVIRLCAIFGRFAQSADAALAVSVGNLTTRLRATTPRTTPNKARLAGCRFGFARGRVCHVGALWL